MLLHSKLRACCRENCPLIRKQREHPLERGTPFSQIGNFLINQQTAFIKTMPFVVNNTIRRFSKKTHEYLPAQRPVYPVINNATLSRNQQDV